MYGMVNSYLRKFILHKFGATTWESIIQPLGIDESPFLEMEVYDDSITYDIVLKLNEVTKIEVKDLLYEFGIFWVDKTSKNDYSMYFEMSHGVVNFLENLNRMHQLLKMTLGNLKPPNFTLEKISESNYELIYISERPGLESFVCGLLKGLSTHFKVDLEIVKVETLELGTCFSLKITD